MSKIFRSVIAFVFLALVINMIVYSQFVTYDVASREEAIRIFNRDAFGLHTADISGLDLSGLTMTNGNISYALAVGTDFSDTNLSGTDLRSTWLTDANLAGGDVRDANFSNAVLTGANLSDTAMARADFTGATVQRVLGQLRASNATFDNAIMSGNHFFAKSNFSRASLMNADMSYSWFMLGKFVNAELNGANMTGAKMVGANFSGADLTGANLTGAFLMNADFSYADLSGANLLLANFEGATLTGAVLNDATTVITTIRPDGTVCNDVICLLNPE